jgi:hypothetical protein
MPKNRVRERISLTLGIGALLMEKSAPVPDFRTRSEASHGMRDERLADGVRCLVTHNVPQPDFHPDHEKQKVCVVPQIIDDEFRRHP